MTGLSIYAMIAGSLLLAVWKCPAVALAGMICMFGLEQWGQATTPFLLQHQSTTNYLVGGILVVALIAQGVKKRLSLIAGYPTVGWLTLGLFLYAFASTQWAPRSDISMDLWVRQWPYVIAFVVLAPLLITEVRDLRASCTGLVLVGGLLTILLFFFVKWESRRIILDHGVGNPLAVAAMAGMVALVIILADPWQESKLWFPLKWGLVALCLALIVRSGSRGQLLSFLLVSVACWPISRGLKNVKQFAVLSFVILFLGAATSWTIQEFWGDEATGRGGRWNEQSAERDVSGRVTNALFLVRLAADSPETLLFGLGNSASYDPRILGFYPHFVPLEILAEEGLIGFGLYVMILYYALRSTVRSFRLIGGRPRERMLLGSLLSLCLFMLVLSFKQGSLLGNVEFFMLSIILGRYEGILSSDRAIEKSEEESEGRPSISISDQPTLQTERRSSWTTP